MPSCIASRVTQVCSDSGRRVVARRVCRFDRLWHRAVSDPEGLPSESPSEMTARMYSYALRMCYNAWRDNADTFRVVGGHGGAVGDLVVRGGRSGQARQVLTAESPSPLTRRRPAPFPFDNGSVTHLEPLQNDISVRGRVCPARLSHEVRSWTRRQMTGDEYPATRRRICATASRIGFLSHAPIARAPPLYTTSSRGSGGPKTERQV